MQNALARAVTKTSKRALLMTSPSKFYISLKSFFFGHDWAGSASEK